MLLWVVPTNLETFYPPKSKRKVPEEVALYRYDERIWILVAWKAYDSSSIRSEVYKLKLDIYIVNHWSIYRRQQNNVYSIWFFTQQDILVVDINLCDVAMKQEIRILVHMYNGMIRTRNLSHFDDLSLNSPILLLLHDILIIFVVILNIPAIM